MAFYGILGTFDDICITYSYTQIRIYTQLRIYDV